MTVGIWKVGDMVRVASRTWAGINKPGGCAKITEVHYHDDGTTLKSYDVKYVVGSGGEKELDPALIFPFETLERGRRSRRGRDFLVPAADKENKDQSEPTSKKKRKDLPNKGNRNIKRGKEDTADDSPPLGSLATTTPTTPDRKPAKSKAKRVTPIPSLVIAKESVDISPLERLTTETSKAQAAASKCRRELFDAPVGDSKSNLAGTKAKRKDKKTQEGMMSAINGKMTAKGAHPSQRQHPTKAGPPAAKLPLTLTKRDEVVGKAKISNSTFARNKNEWDITPNDTSRIIDKRRDRPQSKSVIEGKKAAEAILSRPRPNQSQQKIPNVPITGKRVPLKDVYEEEVRKAKEFVQEVMNAGDPDTSSNSYKESAALEVANTSGKTCEHSMRNDQFLAAFRTLRMKFEDDDGAIDENRFLSLVNELSPKDSTPFSKDEVDRHIEILGEQGKVMKSDGIIYMID